MFWTDFEKCSNIKFRDSPFSGSEVIACEQMGRRTDGQADRWAGGQTHMTKLVVDFRNFVVAPVTKNPEEVWDYILQEFMYDLFSES
jgi:hypothetical protein